MNLKIRIKKGGHTSDDIQYLSGADLYENTLTLHDLKANFDQILPILNETLYDKLNTAGNLQFYSHQPVWSDTHIITSVLLQEALGIYSERWLSSKLQIDYSTDFPASPHRTRYNHQRRRLAGWIERLARLWSPQICPHEDDRNCIFNLVII